MKDTIIESLYTDKYVEVSEKVPKQHNGGLNIFLCVVFLVLPISFPSFPCEGKSASNGHQDDIKELADGEHAGSHTQPKLASNLPKQSFKGVDAVLTDLQVAKFWEVQDDIYLVGHLGVCSHHVSLLWGQDAVTAL